MSFTQQTHHGVTFHTADAFTAAGGWPTVLPPGWGREYRPLCPAEPGHHPPGRAGGGPGELPPLLRCHRRGRNPPGDDPPGPRGRDPVATAADVLPDLLDPIDYRVDGLVTNTPGLALTIYYADCIPVLLYDPVGKAIAAVHSGWRGTSLGIAPKAVAKMTALYGTSPEDVLAAIGPGIGPCFALRPTTMSPPRWRTGWGRRSGPSATPGTGGGQVHRGPQGHHRLGTAPGGAGRGTHRHPAPVYRLPPELYWSHRKMGDQRGNHAAMIALEG